MSKDEKEQVETPCAHTSAKLKNGKYVCTRCGEPLDQKFQRSVQTY